MVSTSARCARMVRGNDTDRRRRDKRPPYSPPTFTYPATFSATGGASVRSLPLYSEKVVHLRGSGSPLGPDESLRKL